MVSIACESPEELNRVAADIIIGALLRSLENQEHATFTLAGGSTPKGVYSLLAESVQLPWERIHLLFGDERVVDPQSIDSNYRMAMESLISRIKIPESNIHRVPTEEGAERAARSYEQTIRSLSTGVAPSLDIVLLGIGPDGHTASLFPGQPQLEAEGLVTSTPPAPREPRVQRVTMTFSLLNSASTVLFLVSGEEKRSVVRRILAGGEAAKAYPAARVRPHGRLIWAVYPPAAQL